MYARSFNMLHYARNENILPVADGIYFNFYALEILVYEHRMVAIHLKSQRQVAK